MIHSLSEDRRDDGVVTQSMIPIATARRGREGLQRFVPLPSMHRDTKIGLAMSILLIGLAAALCSRREEMRPMTPSAPSDLARVDAEIAELPVRAYVAAEGIESGASRSSQQQLAEMLKPSAPAFRPADMFGPRSDVVATSPQPAPDPIRMAPALPTAALPEPGKTESRSDFTAATASQSLWNNSHPETSSLNASGQPSNSAPVRHVVQPGDTLSGIALQYLGSVARFPEIFEANRDVLSSPDALRLGMELRIPR